MSSHHDGSTSGHGLASSPDTGNKSCAHEGSFTFLADSSIAREAGLQACSYLLDLLIRNDIVIINNPSTI
jgi:hypothetical protein